MKMFFRLFFVSIFLLAAAGSVTADQSATILNAEGSVNIKTSQAAAWQSAQKGQKLEVGGEISTENGASCDVLIGESVVKLKPGSKAVLTSLDPVRIDLLSGKIFTLVKGLGKGSNFSVGTPTAVASARGTGWGQDENAVEVFEDIVHVQSTNGETLDLLEGQGVGFGEDGGFGDIYEVGEEITQEFNDFKNDNEGSDGTDNSGFDNFDSGGSGEDNNHTDNSEITEQAQNDAEEVTNDEKKLDELLKPEPPKTDDENNFSY